MMVEVLYGLAGLTAGLALEAAVEALRPDPPRRREGRAPGHPYRSAPPAREDARGEQ